MADVREQLIAALTRDDLFLRVSLFVFGLSSVALGATCMHWLAFSPPESLGWIAAGLCIAVFFLAWGSLIFVSAFTAPSSRWSKVAGKCYPEPAALDDAAFLLIVVLFPAVILTLVLRVLGVRGYVT